MSYFGFKKSEIEIKRKVFVEIQSPEIFKFQVDWTLSKGRMQDQSQDKTKAKISPHIKETTKFEQTQNVNLVEKNQMPAAK